MPYYSPSVNIACTLMIAGVVCLSPIGLAVYFAVCVGVIVADHRASAMLKGN